MLTFLTTYWHILSALGLLALALIRLYIRFHDDVASDWDGTKWVTNAGRQNSQIDELRRRAYETESDPLFFKEQREEVVQGTWAAKVAEIKAKYPKISA